MRSPATILCLIVLAGAAAAAADRPSAELGRAGLDLPALEAAGLPRSGLAIVAAKDGDGIAERLARSGRYLVQRLAPLAELDGRRRAALDAGLHGSIVYAPLPADGRLVHPSRFAELIIHDDAIASEEADRVLNVGGVAVRLTGGTWRSHVRPVEAGIAGWTQKWYDAAGNPLSRDAKAGPPTTIQWHGGPGENTGHHGGQGETPVIGEGVMAYVDQKDGGSYVRSAGNGLLRWAGAFNGNITRTLILADGQLLQRADPSSITRTWGDPERFPREGGSPVAFSLIDGKPLRTYANAPATPRSGPIEYPAMLLAGDALICSGGSELAVLDRATGALRWSAKLPAGSWGEPRVADGVLVAFECAPESGFRRGRIDAAAGVVAMTAFDLASGARRWRTEGLLPDPAQQPAKAGAKPLPRLTLRGAAIAEGGIFLYASSYQTLAADAYLSCHDLADGKQRWRFVIPRGIGNSGLSKELWASTDSASAPVYREGKLYYIGGHGAGGIATFDAKTGAMLGEFRKGPGGFAYTGGCGMSRSTVNWLIQAGVNFFAVDDLSPVMRPAVRSGCGIGTIPAQGMMFATPAACNCDHYLRGFLGLNCEPPPPRTADAERSIPGPGRSPAASEDPAAADWPTFLANPQRNPAVAEALPMMLKPAWSTAVAPPSPAGILLESRMLDEYWIGGVTAATAQGNSLVVGLPDAHAVACLDAGSGAVRWRVPLGGPIDMPPSLGGGLAVAGSLDGRVTALRLSDGAIAWSFDAAPNRRPAVLSGRLASAYPVPGVTIAGDRVLAIAGTHPWLGGLHAWSLDLATGAIRGSSVTEGRSSVKDAPMAMFDMLSANEDGSAFFLASLRFDRDANASFPRGRTAAKDGPLIKFERRSAIMRRATIGRGLSTHGWYAAQSGGIRTMRLVRDATGIYALEDALTAFPPSGGMDKKAWTMKTGIEAHTALIKAGDRIYVGGGSRDGSRGAILVIAASSGAEIQRLDVPAQVVAGGLVATGGRLIVSLVNGTVIAFAG